MKITKTFYAKWGEGLSELANGATPTPAQINRNVSIYINIPFKVKKIHVKNISYVSARNSVEGNAYAVDYITVCSELVNNNPIGMVYKDSSYPMNTIQDIEHVFDNPEIIQGYYNFITYLNDGTLNAPFFVTITPAVFPIPELYQYEFDRMSFVIEFNDENEI